MHAVTLEQLEEISRAIAVRIVGLSGADVSSVALDMTNFATFIATANGKAPVAQRGKAKQKRSDLRLAGPGPGGVTRDGGIPLTSHAYPGDRPDVTQFPAMIDQLLTQYQAVTAAAGVPAAAVDMTVVFDAGQNSQDNFAHLAGDANLHYIGSVPASDCPDLTALPARVRAVADEQRFGGLTAYDTRREAYGTQRRTIFDPLTRAARRPGPRVRRHHPGQAPARNWTSWPPPWPAARPAGRRQKSKRRSRRSPASPGSAASSPGSSTATSPKDLRLAWSVDPAARTALEEEIFGKHVLITDHDDWPVPEVIAGYRSQSEAEFSFRQMKDPHVVSFSPMHHWTEHNIKVHVFTCVLALQIAHLMRRTAAQAGLRLSVRQLLAQLAGIGETVLIYPSTGSRPRARRMITELTSDQRELYEIFDLAKWAPRS